MAGRVLHQSRWHWWRTERIARGRWLLSLCINRAEYILCQLCMMAYSKQSWFTRFIVRSGRRAFSAAIFISATGKISFFTSRIWKSQLLSIWIYFLYCKIKSTITIIPIINNLIDAEWPIVLSLRNEHNKPITIQHRAWDTFCMFILILFCGSFTSSVKILLKY